MKADELISKAERFSMSFIAKISDKTEQGPRKQAYFLDNQEELQNYMNALQRVIVGLSEAESVTDEDQLLIDRAQVIVNDLKKAISEYQKELTISDSVSEEDTTAALTQESIAEAMQNNKTTQEISANMQAIAEQQKVASQVPYNYALVCDGQVTMLTAHSKGELNKLIADITSAGNYKDVNLFKMTFTPVPLKTKTVFAV